MATPESKASDNVLRRANDWKCRLFRNNSGAFKTEEGRLVRFGLGNTSKEENEKYKSGDHVGWYPMTITPDMVGKTVAVYVEIESKAEGFVERDSYPKRMREHAQLNRINLIKAHNGIAGFASNWQDVDKLFKDFFQRLLK